MISALDPLREFSFLSVAVRLAAAALAGGIVGYGRAVKKRPAGIRTYILTCVGAALTVLIAAYEYEMLSGQWAPIVAEVGMKFDGSRSAAQAISGMGFLASGSILAASHQRVSGLTTATGLFATVCMGIAAGAGFYELVIIAAILIQVTLEGLYPLEGGFKRRIRNITLFVEYEHPEDFDEICRTVTGRGASLHDIEIEQHVREGNKFPGAVIHIQMSQEMSSHSGMLSAIAQMPCVVSIYEVVG